MISKQYIKDLDFKTIDDIYEYIIESELNGNYQQTKELINKLSSGQFKEFLSYQKGVNYEYDFMQLREMV